MIVATVRGLHLVEEVMTKVSEIATMKGEVQDTIKISVEAFQMHVRRLSMIGSEKIDSRMERELKMGNSLMVQVPRPRVNLLIAKEIQMCLAPL